MAACLITLLSFFLSHYCHPFSSSLHLSSLPSLSCTLPQTCTHAYTQTHTHLCFSWHFFPLFHPTLLYLHALSLSKVTTFVFMSYPLCVGVCVGVCEAYGHSLSHTQTHKHLSMPLGPCAQLSVSLILFPLISTHPPTPTSCSSSFSLTSHPFLIIPGSYSLSLFWGVISSFIINDVYFWPVQV